jgi:hypothetical protein
MDKKKFYPHKLHLVSKQVYDKRKKDLEFYHYTSIEFIALIHKLRQNIEALENELALLKQSNAEKSMMAKYHLKDFNSSWSYSIKICFILLCNDKPMDSLEIYMTLMNIDGKFSQLKRPQTTLSSIITGMRRSEVTTVAKK